MTDAFVRDALVQLAQVDHLNLLRERLIRAGYRRGYSLDSVSNLDHLDHLDHVSKLRPD